jgi:quercetin dioxygenase-like cupin family protein
MNDELTFLDNRVRVHVTSARTGVYALLESEAPAGSQPPLHLHRDEDEGFYVVEGELTMWVGAATQVLHAGDFAFGPREVPHTLRVGATGARWLVTAGPRFEAFVRAVAASGAAHVNRLAAEHGIELLGPPGMLPGELAA